MLRKFNITIDGKKYLVEMEEIGGTPQSYAPPAVSPAATAVKEAPAAEPTPAPAPAPAPAGGDAMTAPMPGTVLKLLVNAGDTVTENQPLLILEAMKMENEIVAPHAGKVSHIHVTSGQAVNPGDALVTIS